MNMWNWQHAQQGSRKNISHTNAGKKDNATPLFDWGKYY